MFRPDLRNASWYNRKSTVFLCSFLLPMVLFALLCWVKGIYPFGGTSLLCQDLDIQYADFFSFYKDHLLSPSGFLYSFSKSLGGPMLALSGYYLASPLNLLMVFFSKQQIPLFLFVITGLKLGLCGLFFALYLEGRFQPGERRWLLVFLALSYSFTQYTVGQMFNIMWLDGVYLLPLMLLGAYRYLSQDRPGLLYASVALSILFSWYTAYMNCLFLVIYYFYEMACLKQRIGILRTLRYWGVLLLGVLASGVLFLPVILGQSTGRSILDGTIFAFYTNGSLLEVLRGFVIGSDMPSTQITLFCSTFVLLFFFAFWFDSSRSWRDRLPQAALLAVMVASLFFAPLEHIWCGFRFEDSYQYRFSYLAIAVVILIAANQLLSARGGGFERGLFAGAAVWAAALLVLDWQEQFPAKKLWAQLILIACYLFLFVRRQTRRRMVSAAVPVLFAAELMLNAHWITEGRYTVSVGSYQSYLTAQQTLVDAVKASDTQGQFYRMDQTLNRDNNPMHNSFYANESLTYGYSSIQQYSSCYDGPTARLLRDLGYSRADMPSFYHSPILAADSLLGVRYLLSEVQYPGFEPVEEIAPANGKQVYRNPYALPLAFAAGEDILSCETGSNPFETMNAVYSAIVGHPVELFTPCTGVSAQIGGGSAEFTVPAAGEGQLLYFTCTPRNDSVSLLVNGTQLTDYSDSWMSTNVLYLNTMEAETLVSLQGVGGDFSADDAQFYTFDLDLFGQVIGEIRAGSDVTDRVSDGQVTLTSQNSTDGWLLVTVPYDSHWQVQVNGQTVSFQPALGGMTAIPVQAGENTIRMQYRPAGLEAGAAASAVSLGCFALLCIRRRRKSAA